MDERTGATGGPGDLPGLDLGALARWLAAEAPGVFGGTLGGPLTGRLVAGGKSNLTYEVSDGRRTVIVRRPPLGHVLATAHDMVREHRVITALGGTAVPVPETYALCATDAVLGAPFYVMERVAGTPFRSARQLEPLGPERTRRIAERMVDTLVALHAIDPQEVGLADFGRPEGYLERQVRRWQQQLDRSRTRDIEGIDELHARLARNVPVQPGRSVARIVHGDFRLDNLLVDTGEAVNDPQGGRDARGASGPSDPSDADRVTAVLDWEMATLGDPLTDVALFAAYQGLSELAGGAVVSDVGAAPGYPPAAELLDRYGEGSGRDLSGLSWHLGLAHFKLAVILEGIHYRYVHGQTVGEGFDTIGDFIGPLVHAGLESMKE